MDRLQFVASVVGSLAWPTVALVVVILFRSQIVTLLSGPLSRFKAGPVEAEWDRTTQQIEQSLDEQRPAPFPVTPPARPETTRRPAAAEIIEAHWQRVEDELRIRLKAHPSLKPEAVDNLSGEQLVASARNYGAINEASYRSVEGLHVLRKLADKDADPDKARDYATLVDAAVYAMRNAEHS